LPAPGLNGDEPSGEYAWVLNGSGTRTHLPKSTRFYRSLLLSAEVAIPPRVVRSRVRARWGVACARHRPGDALRRPRSPHHPPAHRTIHPPAAHRRSRDPHHHPPCAAHHRRRANRKPNRAFPVFVLAGSPRSRYGAISIRRGAALPPTGAASCSPRACGSRHDAEPGRFGGGRRRADRARPQRIAWVPARPRVAAARQLKSLPRTGIMNICAWW